MKLKSKCCKKYKSKAKACQRCPLMAVMSKKVRKKTLKKYRRRIAKAA